MRLRDTSGGGDVLWDREDKEGRGNGEELLEEVHEGRWARKESDHGGALLESRKRREAKVVGQRSKVDPLTFVGNVEWRAGGHESRRCARQKQKNPTEDPAGLTEDGVRSLGVPESDGESA
jgi:hypothetical protein